MVTARDSLKIDCNNQPDDELHIAIERVFRRSQVQIKACRTAGPDRFFVVYFVSILANAEIHQFPALLHPFTSFLVHSSTNALSLSLYIYIYMNTHTYILRHDRGNTNKSPVNVIPDKPLI